jgi:ribosomal protein S18 acetylase RimI-like enzyme
MKIRPYTAADAGRLTAIHNEIKADLFNTTDRFDGHMRHVIASGGRAWVLSEGTTIVVYAATSPVPGLDAVMNLEGFIVPARQRRGLGSHLLRHVMRELRETDARQLSYCLTSLDGPAAEFLRRHRFFLEHEESMMRLSDLTGLPERADGEMQTFSREKAIRTFCALYRQSFIGFPWYQPYSEGEVETTLDSPPDLQFLIKRGRPIGFVWTRLGGTGVGEIEPIGVVKREQGQGHGRTLLLAGLHRLAHLGAREAKIGVWRDNRVAIALYQDLGFQLTETLAYLAYNI